jgi:hypothetical protein
MSPVSSVTAESMSNYDCSCSFGAESQAELWTGKCGCGQTTKLDAACANR